ncbi:rhodanese-like domain-containing protein [Pseudogemmobacter sp. W21_MBD1_M6]|uniref:rhodanese-like domain-containing protein n=1 Tax=Pseudogemmobacter sp. W21_MBD1_M6 TaxID=3240271 RepID=UPI003F9E6CE9
MAHVICGGAAGQRTPDIQTQKDLKMAYTEKFQTLADTARAQVDEVNPQDVDALIAAGAVALDIRDKEEHDAGHIEGSVNISRGKLEMNVEGVIPDLETTILCYCNAYNRGALSAATLRGMGFKNAKFIAGGLNAYRKLG